MDETLRKLERVGDSVAIAKWRRRLGENIPPVVGERVKLKQAQGGKATPFYREYVGMVGTVEELRKSDSETVEAWLVVLDATGTLFPAYDGELEIL